MSWQGEPLASVREAFHRQLLWLGHKPGVKTALTADENLHFFFPHSRQQTREAALAEMGLAGYEDVPLSQLSAGQQRRGGVDPPVVDVGDAVDPRRAVYRARRVGD
ncbi:Cytochrome c biogenesis ATP-binding export protein CcmA [Raoultella planticola]|uniref:Cytochrome c biogenesis ATP-binding export protein CcmA n=1 Tax=Raoultella planticola TaxID=575 RepID=A0A485ALR3_RAOPL|nr:Cytochrome c biogenesis ATP-binding export protein CcmA [Raoultella planticola]